MTYDVKWSLESSQKVEEIKEYLYEKWTFREVHSFLSNLKKFETIVRKYPELYPISESYPKLRKAIISKYHAVIYEIDGSYILVSTILDNRQDNKI